MATSNPEIVGIDFSGAMNAGKHIWVSTGSVSGGALRLSSCERASSLFSSKHSKRKIFGELVDWIDSLQGATVGLDFPFGVPEDVANIVFHATSWEEFMNSGSWRGLTPDRFRDQCTNFSHNELRDTDAIHRADCPHSIRIYKQTFHGIKDVLRPLNERDVSIAPMVRNRDTTVLETYPAATLARDDDLYASRYKNRASTRERRVHNVNALSRLQDLDISGIETSKIENDSRGDAMDSVVAALATFRASYNKSPFNTTSHTRIEGHIYA